MQYLDGHALSIQPYLDPKVQIQPQLQTRSVCAMLYKMQNQNLYPIETLGVPIDNTALN